METARAPSQPSTEDSEEPAAEEGEGEKEIVKIFEEPRTYLKLKLNFSDPIVPTEENFVHRARPHDLIPQSPAPPKIPPAKDAEEDFRR